MMSQRRRPAERLDEESNTSRYPVPALHTSDPTGQRMPFAASLGITATYLALSLCLSGIIYSIAILEPVNDFGSNQYSPKRPKQPPICPEKKSIARILSHWLLTLTRRYSPWQSNWRKLSSMPRRQRGCSSSGELRITLQRVLLPSEAVS